MKTAEGRHLGVRDVIDRHLGLRVLLGLLLIIAGYFLLTGIWGALVAFSDILLLFFLAWLIAFILLPIADWLYELGVPRLAAVALVYLALLLGIILLVRVALPVIQDQVTRLVVKTEALFSPANLNALGPAITAQLQQWGMSQSDTNNLLNQLENNLPAAANAVLQNTTNVFTSIVTSIISILLDTVIVLILSFYIMLDGRRLLRLFINNLPVSWRSDAHLLQEKIAKSFGGYIRGQLILGAFYGIATFLTLTVLGLQNGVIIALLSGILMLLPFVGPFFALVPPVILELLEASPDSRIRTLIILLIVLVIFQQIVMQVLAPRVLGESVGLHPLVVFAALLIGAKEAGIWGAFFGIPIAGVLFAMFRVFFDRFVRSSPLYQEKEAAEEGSSTLLAPVILSPLSSPGSHTATGVLPHTPVAQAEAGELLHPLISENDLSP